MLGKLAGPTQRNLNGHLRSLSLLRLDRDDAIHQVGAFLHSHNSYALPGFQLRSAEAHSFISYSQAEVSIHKLERDVDLLRLRVLGDIAQTLLKNMEEAAGDVP